jgi:hypothetical protein
MSANIETQVDASQGVVTERRVVALGSDPSEFVDRNDGLVQLSAGRPRESEIRAATEIVEMRPNEPLESDLRTAA